MEFGSIRIRKTTLIQIRLTSLTKKGELNLYGLHSPLQEVDEGVLAEKGSTKMTKWPFHCEVFLLSKI